MITLCTGQPGHGKTQWALRQAVDAAKAGRAVYVGNVTQLDHAKAGTIPIDDFNDWESCPDGALIVWDECYTALPQRAAGRKVPPAVEALARHRHRGFDFILICQQPQQIDGFVFGLVERHLHFRRRFGTTRVSIKEWDRGERDVVKTAPHQVRGWALDKSVWGLYKSATEHNVKVRLPWYVIALPIAVVGVLAALYGLPASFHARAKEIEQTREAAPATLFAMPGAQQQQPLSEADILRRTDPLALMRPRVPGAPWTAPAYDGVALAPPPQVACMSSPKSCTCITIDQGTLWVMDDQLCRLQARNGRYDPTRQTAQERGTRPPEARAQQQPPKAADVAASASAGPRIGTNYTFPQQ